MREKEMLATAERLFGERGFESVSMDEIAERSGVTKPMLNAYFDSKQSLFAARGHAAAARLREDVRAAAATEAGLAPDERLWRAFLAVFRFLDENRGIWSFFQAPAGELPVWASEGAARAREEMSALLSELMTETAREGGIGEQAAEQIEPLGHALTAATVAIGNWWLSHPQEPLELQAMRLMNFVWKGFEALLGGDLWVPTMFDSDGR